MTLKEAFDDFTVCRDSSKIYKIPVEEVKKVCYHKIILDCKETQDKVKINWEERYLVEITVDSDGGICTREGTNRVNFLSSIGDNREVPVIFEKDDQCKQVGLSFNVF